MMDGMKEGPFASLSAQKVRALEGHEAGFRSPVDGRQAASSPNY
jgi:hypothetical protein